MVGCNIQNSALQPLCRARLRFARKVLDSWPSLVCEHEAVWDDYVWRIDHLVCTSSS
jgi:hypothetical protein